MTNTSTSNLNWVRLVKTKHNWLNEPKYRIYIQQKIMSPAARGNHRPRFYNFHYRPISGINPMPTVRISYSLAKSVSCNYRPIWFFNGLIASVSCNYQLTRFFDGSIAEGSAGNHKDKTWDHLNMDTNYHAIGQSAAEGLKESAICSEKLVPPKSQLPTTRSLQ